MKAKSLDEWIREFEVKTKNYFAMEPREVLVWDKYKGFCGYVIVVDRMELFITKMMGDGEFWIKKVRDAYEQLKGLGVTHVATRTIRNPKAFCRRFKCQLQAVEEHDNGQPIYLIRYE